MLLRAERGPEPRSRCVRRAARWAERECCREGCCGTGGEGQSAAGQSVSAGAQGSCRAASSRVAVLCTLRPVPGTQVLIWLLGHERDCKDAHVCWFWRGHRAELGRADLAGPWHGADSLMFTDI